MYLQLVEKVLKQDQQVLLVPEIGLAPQTLSGLNKGFIALLVLHSSMNDTERLQGWLNARQLKVGIIIGTRSAVFTPIPKLGLIIVDEEHDSSYKQEAGRYHSRDVAIWRATTQYSHCFRCTPSLESLYNCQYKNYQHLTLTKRVSSQTTAVSVTGYTPTTHARKFIEHCIRDY